MNEEGEKLSQYVLGLFSTKQIPPIINRGKISEIKLLFSPEMLI